MKIKKGDIIELDIEKYAFEGKGIAKINKDSLIPGSDEGSSYVIFVHGSYPGDKVKAKLLKIKKSYAEAKAVEIITPSEYRIQAVCSYFGTCGGCKQQDLDYPRQLFYKQQQVEEIFNRLGGFSEFKMEDIVPSEHTFFYRNKMEYSFADRRWLTEAEISSGADIQRDFALGLHIPGAYDKVLDINGCFLQSEVSNKILLFTREFFKSRGISIYSTKTHTGFLRNLVIKQSSAYDDLMVNLVTSSENPELLSQYRDQLLSEVPQISTVINNVNLKKASVATGDYEVVLHGSGYIYDEIGGFKFRISANSFFQTNTHQANKLYSAALEFAGLSGDEIVYDLYSGAGTISIYVSGKASSVYAFETVESAIADAHINAEINSINNVSFFTADLYKSFLPEVDKNSLPRPDVVITDPPRSGMHENTVNDVIALDPKKIVYVSCNPATQARDVKLFAAAGYKLIKMRPVDMFPHTYHIENAALLEKNTK